MLQKEKRSIRTKFFDFLARFPNIFMIYKAVAVVVVWCGIWGLAEQVVDAAEKFFPVSYIRPLGYFGVLLFGLFLLWADDKSLSELTDIRQVRREIKKELRRRTDKKNGAVKTRKTRKRDLKKSRTKRKRSR